ncbi:MAG TPA: hypothetical protein VK894_02575 [Jiangellales bacterium]|nr:hypothetical protein [Jiangellales bacterium]
MNGPGDRPGADGAAVVSARAVHAPGLLARIAVVVNPYAVTGLDYRVAADGAAAVTLTVAGGSWEADRVAARLRRVIGVTAVVLGVAAADGAPEPVAGTGR